jgi:NhaP-type Na+/H+ or K+/H+ antiporter
MTERLLSFNQQLEHIAEFAMVLLLGILLSISGFSVQGFILAVLLFVIIRPLSVSIGLIGAECTRLEYGIMAWFGIRGIGSLYYLAFALQYQWLPDLAYEFVSIVTTVVAMSVVVHGISSTPLMDLYYKRTRRRNA